MDSATSSTRALADLLDPGADPALQRVVARISAGLSIEVALVTVLDAEQQTMAAEVGAPADLAASRASPISWSFCRRVVQSDAPLIIEDAGDHPDLEANPLVRDGIVRSYAGVPVRVDGYGTCGAVCAISPSARRFSEADLGLLELAAEAAGRRLGELARDRGRAGAGVRLSPKHGAILDDRWRLTAELGHGGQGAVWAARELGSGRLVAVKLGDAAVAREEAQALASVRHPNLVTVHAAGSTADGGGYLVIDHVAGAPLLDVADARPDRDAFVLGRLAEVAGALNSLHAAGILHGDLKVHNVLLEESTERAILIDLGLGLRDGEPARPRGTPGMSAPEQFDSSVPQLDTRVDTYGLAAMAYQLLTTRTPFKRKGDTPRQVVLRQRADDWVPLSRVRPDLAHLDAPFADALAAEPARRPRSPIVFLASVTANARGALPGHPTRADILRACRALVRQRGGVDEEFLRRLDPEARQALADAEEGSPYVSTDAFVSCVQSAVVHAGAGTTRNLARLVGAQTARALVRSAHVLFDPRSLATALPGMLCRSHPWARLDLGEVTTSAVHGVMDLPSHPETLSAWFTGVIEALFARAGATATVTWRRSEASHELHVRWSLD